MALESMMEDGDFDGADAQVVAILGLLSDFPADPELDAKHLDRLLGYLGLPLKNRGSSRTPAEILSRYKVGGPMPWAYFEGLLKARRGGWDEAGECFARALEFSGENAFMKAQAAHFSGIYRMKKGEILKACELFSFAISTGEASPWSHLELGIAKAKLGKPGEAEADFKKAFDLAGEDAGLIGAMKEHLELKLPKRQAAEGF
jgi:tetratricopeptide (TPR) repeat protein